MLDRDDRRVGPDYVGPRNVAYGVEGAGECLLQGNHVLDHCCWGVVVTSSILGLRAGLGVVAGDGEHGPWELVGVVAVMMRVVCT